MYPQYNNNQKGKKELYEKIKEMKMRDSPRNNSRDTIPDLKGLTEYNTKM
jgi:hypothetical protein